MGGDAPHPAGKSEREGRGCVETGGGWVCRVAREGDQWEINGECILSTAFVAELGRIWHVTQNRKIPSPAGTVPGSHAPLCEVKSQCTSHDTLALQVAPDPDPDQTPRPPQNLRPASTFPFQILNT